MPASAYLFPIVSRVEWERSRIPASTLTQVNPKAPIDVIDYAARDYELAYRDLVVAGAISRVATRVADIWGFEPARPVLPSPPDHTLEVSDAPTPSSPGSVTYVDNQSVAYDAITTDAHLYARDILVYQSLYESSRINLAGQNPVEGLSLSLSVNDAWSLAESSENQAGIGYGSDLNPALFKRPDQHLAWRDNVLAAYVARMKNAFERIWSLAQRVLLRVVDDRGILYEPETYALISDDGRYRVWSAAPRIPNQLQLTYDRERNTISWVGERPGIAGSPAVSDTSVVVGGALVTREPDIQPASDSEYYRQKSFRVPTQFFSDNTIYSTFKPNDFIVSGGVYQEDSALLTVPSTARFALPVVIPAGCVRIGLLVRPAANFGFLGFQNVGGSTDGTAVTITTAQTINWNVTLPKGRIYYSITLTDKLNRTPAFAVRVRYNTTTIFDGSYVFNKDPGVSYETQSVEFESDGLPANFSIEWLGGEGQLTVESINFVVNSAVITANYGLGLQLNTSVARPVNFLGVSERPDVVLFDVVVPDEMVNPTLIVDWIGGGSLVLFIHGYDVKVFDLVEPVANASNYEPYRASLLQAAESSVSSAYKQFVKANPNYEFRTKDDVYGYVWDDAAYLRWISALKGSGEARIESAFQLAGPSDLGRPAIVPDGLESSEGMVVKANYGLSRGVPRLRALQPWMMSFGVRVAGPDFWPLNHPGCTWYGPLETIGVDPDFEVSSSIGTPSVSHINNLTISQILEGSPVSTGNRAYTVQNSGPAGGTVSQTVRYVVWMNNLRVGSVYELTATIVTALVTEDISVGVTSTVTTTFQATAVSQSFEPDPIVATTGYQVWLQSVTLA